MPVLSLSPRKLGLARRWLTQRRPGAQDRQEQAQAALLVALQQGAVLKVHRGLDGDKIYRLHRDDARAEDEQVADETVASLTGQGLLQSNMKFPAATFLLTDKGIVLARQLSGACAEPTGPRNYS